MEPSSGNSSSGGSAGSTATVNLLDMDVDAALQELAAGHVSSAPAGTQHADILRADSQPTSSQVPEQDVHVPEQALSESSTDSEVIYIDLTKRPPPLPMSGLALEQVVSMLPGDTYAVAGSGIPFREHQTPPDEQPASQPSGHSPKASPAAAAPPVASPGADADFEAPGIVDPEAVSQRPAGTSSRPGSGGGAGPSGGSSPRMAFTFIHGLGLVPVAIHADGTEDDEGEEDGSCVAAEKVDDGGEQSLPQTEHSAGQEPLVSSQSYAGSAFGATGEAAATCEPIGVGVAEEAASYGPSSFTATTADGAADSAPLQDLTAAGTSLDFDTFTAHSDGGGAFGRHFPSEAGAAGGVGVAAPAVNISEEQLRDIIQQAIDGMSFGSMSFDIEDVAQSEGKGNKQLGQPQPRNGGTELQFYDAQEAFGVTDFATENRFLEAISNAAEPTPEPGPGSMNFGEQAAAEPGRQLRGQKSGYFGDNRNDTEDGAGRSADTSSGEEVYEEDHLAGDDSYLHAEEEEMYGEDSAAPREYGEDDDDSDDGIDAGKQLRVAYRAPSSPGSSAATAAAAEASTATSDAAAALAAKGPVPNTASRDSGVVDAAAEGDSSMFKVFGQHHALGTASSLPSLPRGRYAPNSHTHSHDAASGTGTDASTSDASGAEPGTLQTSSSVPPAGIASRRSSGYCASSSLPTPFAGCVLSTGSDGIDLNSTVRLTGQSLKAIRLAAMQAEAHRQAKAMADGDADRADGDDHRHGNAAASPRRAGVPNIINPFGFAGQQASAAAGLTSLDTTHSTGSRRGNGGHGFSSSASSSEEDGHAADSAQSTLHDVADEGEADSVDILCDRPIIAPRYPTDAPHTHHHHRSHNERAGTEAEDLGTLRPRHRRSAEHIDLNAALGSDVSDASEDGQSPLQASHNLYNRSEADNQNSQPPARSLLAMRKSDDGLPGLPAVSASPRMSDGYDDGSSSAHSVADERLVEELEALREELGQKTTLVAGLRGEVRKFSDLAARLEHQLGELRSQGSQAAVRRTSAACVDTNGAAAGDAQQGSSGPPTAPAITESTPPKHLHLRPPPGTPPPASAPPTRDSVLHTPPPHPQSQGLEGPARLSLYREILSQAQLHVGRSSGPAPSDLRDAQELLQGKETLDAGSEKVMLLKLQKLMAWGCEAAWKASVSQQQLRHNEQVAQQAAQARSAWETEREQLRQALEQARALPSSCVAAGGVAVADEGLRQQLDTSQEELANAREQVSELESVVASLNADVRRLRGQLRSSRDGAPEQAAGHAAAPSSVDSAAWGMERQMLLRTINSLQQEVERAREAADASRSEAAAEASARGSAGASAPETPRTALKAAGELEAERDAAAAESAELRRRLEEALADADEERSSYAAVIQDLRVKLEECRTATQQRLEEAEAQAVIQEQHCADLLAQADGLRHELALRAAKLAEAESRHEEELHTLVAEQVKAAAANDPEVQELREQVKAMEAEIKDARADAAAARKALADEQDRQRQESAFDVESRVDALQVELQRQSREAAASMEALEQVLENESQERDRALEAKALELALAEAQLLDVRAALAQLQAEGAELNVQTVELQALLVRVQREKEDAEAEAVAAKAEAAVATLRASDAEAALGRAREELDAVRKQVAGLNKEAGTAGAQAEAEAALVEARREADELRAAVASLEAEARKLRAAGDEVQELRSRVEGLESELETQAMRAQVLGQHAEEAESALAAAGAKLAEAEDAAVAAAADAASARAEAADLQLRVADLQHRLAEVTRQHEDAQQQATERWLQDDASLAVGNAARLNKFESLNDELRAAQIERDAVKDEADELRKKLEAALQASLTPLPRPLPSERHDSPGETTISQIAALRREKTQLLAECARLQNEVELERVTAGQARYVDSSEGGTSQASVETAPAVDDARVRQLEGQLQAATAELEVTRAELEGVRVEAQAVRGELQTASVELAMKRELLAAKDRSLSTLQETVDALRLAVMATQQMPVPVHEPASGEAQGPSGEPTEAPLQHYQGTVAVLQNKFAGSERTIRRLEQQVAVLEVRLSEGGRAPALARVSSTYGAEHLSAQPSVHAIADLCSQLQDKEAEVLQLQRELELVRRQAADTARSAAASSLAPRSHGPASDPGHLSAAAIHDLQMQIMQWRSLGEDIHARYQSKKEALRQLREQLSTEQQRHAEEQARNQARLEAACQRLGRLSMDLGLALRRCITLDLQPLSATSLTTSPRTQVGGGDAPADINALAALLARQGAALVESLETALEQAASAREERAVLSSQLTHRQAVLDELRHQLVRQTGVRSVPGDLPGGRAAGAVSGGPSAGDAGMQVPVQPAGNIRPLTVAADVRQASRRSSGTAPAADVPGLNRRSGGGAPSSLLGLRSGGRTDALGQGPSSGLASTSTASGRLGQPLGSYHQPQTHASAAIGSMGRPSDGPRELTPLSLPLHSTLRLATTHSTATVYGSNAGSGTTSAGVAGGTGAGLPSNPSLGFGGLHELWSRRSGTGV